MKKEILEGILKDFEKIKDTEIVLQHELPIVLEMAIHRENLWGKMELTRIMLQPGMVIIPYILATVDPNDSALHIYLEVKGIKFEKEKGPGDVRLDAWTKFRCDADILQAHGYLKTEYEL